MTAEEKIKHLILIKMYEFMEKEFILGDKSISEHFEKALNEENYIYDAMSETRCGEIETNIKSDWDRNYESKSVASQYIDGSWIGWTYWYGGGKHSSPNSIDWIPYVYDLTMTEEERVVVVKTFTKIG